MHAGIARGDSEHSWEASGRALALGAAAVSDSRRGADRLTCASGFGDSLLAAPRFASDPFALAVASGGPLPDSVVRWTRLAPDALNRGGMPPANVSVEWEVAADAFMRKSCARAGKPPVPNPPTPSIEVRGLQPVRWYCYRFKSGEAMSRVRPNPHRSAPDADVALEWR